MMLATGIDGAVQILFVASLQFTESREADSQRSH